MNRLSHYFINGLIVLVPIAITYFVKEKKIMSLEEIIHKITEYNAKVQDIRREISINDFRV